MSNATEKLEIIMGKDGLEKIAASSVLVLGCGGVGSNCIEALARGGVGKLIIVDHDTIVCEGAVLSLHSVKATDVVLDLLEGAELFSSNSCIFHWFSGSNNELHRAIKSGCYFSVGERFLSSKRGQEYLKVIPVNQLLFETDLPAQEHSNTTFEELRSSLWSAQDLLLKKSN